MSDTGGAKGRGKRNTQTSGGHGRTRQQARGPSERPAASPPTGLRVPLCRGRLPGTGAHT